MFLPFLHECNSRLCTIFHIQKIGNNIEFSGTSMFMHGWQNLDISLLGLTDGKRIWGRGEDRNKKY